MNFYERVYQAVQHIPRGKVATYGQIAFMAGNSRASRVVGYALHCNPQPGIIPCHRVVNREGRLAPGFAFGGAEIQKDMLLAENIDVFENKGDFYVDLKKYLWREED